MLTRLCFSFIAIDMRSRNPAFKNSTFLNLGSGRMRTSSREVMTFNGTVNKTSILLLLVVMTAAYAWSQVQFCLSVLAFPAAMVFRVCKIWQNTWRTM